MAVVARRRATDYVGMLTCLSVPRCREPGSSRAEVNFKAEGLRWPCRRKQRFTPQLLDVLFSDIIQSHTIISN